MKLSELLKDKLMGVYIEVVKDGNVISTRYLGMKDKKFNITTNENFKEGEKVELKIKISGLNLILPCEVENVEGKNVVLKPIGKVKISEKRSEKRIPTMIPSQLNDYKGIIIDISYHGARILTLSDIALGSNVILKFKKYIIKGKVRWKKSEEVDIKSVGLYFDKPDEWWLSFVKETTIKYIQALRRM